MKAKFLRKNAGFEMLDETPAGKPGYGVQNINDSLRKHEADIDDYDAPIRPKQPSAKQPRFVTSYPEVFEPRGPRTNIVEVQRKKRSSNPLLRNPLLRTKKAADANSPYVLTRDGIPVIGPLSELEAAQYIHKNHSYSLDHAIKHEGYKLVPADDVMKDPTAVDPNSAGDYDFYKADPESLAGKMEDEFLREMRIKGSTIPHGMSRSRYAHVMARARKLGGGDDRPEQEGATVPQRKHIHSFRESDVCPCGAKRCLAVSDRTRRRCTKEAEKNGYCGGHQYKIHEGKIAALPNNTQRVEYYPGNDFATVYEWDGQHVGQKLGEIPKEEFLRAKKSGEYTFIRRDVNHGSTVYIYNKIAAVPNIDEIMSRQPKSPDEIGSEPGQRPFVCTRCGRDFAPNADGFIDRKGWPVHAKCGQPGELQEYKDANKGWGYPLDAKYFPAWQEKYKQDAERRAKDPEYYAQFETKPKKAEYTPKADRLFAPRYWNELGNAKARLKWLGLKGNTLMLHKPWEELIDREKELVFNWLRIKAQHGKGAGMAVTARPKRYPDTLQGAIQCLTDESSLDMRGATGRPDPSVSGVWEVTSKAGHRVIVYLAGYPDPFGKVRPDNDFEVDDSKVGKQSASKPAESVKQASEGEWGVRWQEFNKQNQLVTKEKFVKSEALRAGFVKKLETKDNFKGIMAWSNPPEQKPQPPLDSHPELAPNDEDDPLCVCGRRFYDHDERGQVWKDENTQLCAGFLPMVEETKPASDTHSATSSGKIGLTAKFLRNAMKPMLAPKDVAAKLISAVERDNGIRQGSLLSQLLPGKRNEFSGQLEQGIAQMQVAGATFSDELIELMAMGDQDEAEERFGKFPGYSEANKALNNIFDPQREWIVKN